MNRVMAVLLVAAGLTLPQPDPVCFEDMPCWDCTTMGNQLCGEDVSKP